MSEDLQKQVQEKLAQARKLLEECEALAEQGGFEFSFDFPGTTYYPKNLFSKEEVIEQIKEEMSTEEFSALTPEELDDLIESTREEMKYNTLPEYAELGSWWMPSRFC